MAPQSRRTATALAAAVICGTVATAPPPAVASTGSEILPGPTIGTVTADLDGDGARELVRLASTITGLVVEAWTVVDGDWSLVGSATVGRPPEDASPDPSMPSEMSGLLTWTLENEVRVLVLLAGIDPESEAQSPCCLEIGEVRLRDGSVEVRPLGEAGGADFVQAVDMNGDGTDELMAHATIFDPDTEEGSFRLGILGWNGDGFDALHESEREGHSFGVIAGETDGIPGAEVLSGPTEYGDLLRLGWMDGGIRLDTGHLDLGERSQGWVTGVVDGRFIVTTQDGIRIVRWPRDAPLRFEAHLSGLAFPLISVLGKGPDALILAEDQRFSTVPAATAVLYDLQLRPVGEVHPRGELAAFGELLHSASRSGSYSLTRTVFPLRGPLPGGLDGEAAHIADGLLIQADGEGGIRTRRIAPLVGVHPLGRAGPADSWVVLGGAYAGSGDSTATYLFPHGRVPFEESRLVLMPLAELLRPDPVDPVGVELQGAVEISRDGNTAHLVAPGEGFDAIVTAPPGTVVIVSDGAQFTEHELHGGDLRLEVRPERNAPDDRNDGFERTLILLTPDARGSIVRWNGTFVRESPEVAASGRGELFRLRSTIAGRASPGITVTVDGRPVEQTARGAFEFEVDAPIWPRDVFVVAADPLGNETVQRIQVVGFVDYRGWPWVPILGAATLAAGAVLFIRTPRSGQRRRPGWDDAALEEIDGD